MSDCMTLLDMNAVRQIDRGMATARSPGDGRPDSTSTPLSGNAGIGMQRFLTS